MFPNVYVYSNLFQICALLANSAMPRFNQIRGEDIERQLLKPWHDLVIPFQQQVAELEAKHNALSEFLASNPSVIQNEANP